MLEGRCQTEPRIFPNHVTLDRVFIELECLLDAVVEEAYAFGAWSGVFADYKVAPLIATGCIDTKDVRGNDDMPVVIDSELPLLVGVAMPSDFLNTACDTVQKPFGLLGVG